MTSPTPSRSLLARLSPDLPPTYWLLWLGTLINRLGGFVIPFLTLYLTGQRGLSVSRAALMVSLFGAGSFISGFGFTVLATTLPLFMVSVAIWTVGETLASAIAPTVVADLSPVELRGLYQGVFGAAWGLSYFAGPWLGGIVYQTRGPSTLWAGCLVLGALLAACYLGLGLAARRVQARSVRA